MDAAEIDLANIKYSDVTNNVDEKWIYLSYNDKPIIVQTPEMRCPFGLSKWDNKKYDGQDKESYNLLLAFDCMDKNEILLTFFKKIDDMDKKLKTDGMENWLGRKIKSELVIDELYNPMIRYSREESVGEINDDFPPPPP